VVRARHNADHSPGRPERAIADTFKTDYVAHGSNRARLVLVDRGWPALNQRRHRVDPAFRGRHTGCNPARPLEGVPDHDP
jgi:hypothetical protein